MNIAKHPCKDVRDAIVKLVDALCEWERSTGRESVLIIRECGFTFSAVSGKPCETDDVTDGELIQNILGGRNEEI